jgi:hypothetical protein
MKIQIHWVSLFSGVAIGLFPAGAGGLEGSKEDHARELVLSQIVAIDHLTSQGTPPSAKAEIDAEVARVKDYVTRIRSLEKSGKPWDKAFVEAPWHKAAPSVSP